jgi:cyclopropane-fatty-acyl-phospholipid synthase
LVTARSNLPTTQPLLDQISRLLPEVHLRAYDGCESGPVNAKASIRFTSPRAFVRILRAPRGLGLARAWITGEITIEGDLHYIATHEAWLRTPELLRVALATSIKTVAALGFRELWNAGPTAIEHRTPRPGTHSVKRDLEAADFHYGLSTGFYQRLLGSSMVYSCGIFTADVNTLEEAQNRKHELICNKLRLEERSHVLDIGCGWGAFLKYAIQRHGCRGTGITASRLQYQEARHILDLLDAAKVLHGDYRSVLPLQNLTAAASIGMYEHVGESRSREFFGLVRDSLPVGSHYLNQAIIRSEGKSRKIRRNSFVQRYIFPGGQLSPLSTQLRDLEAANFRIVSVETFGDSYASTLRHWIRNLTRDWDACACLETEARVRAWYMYLTGALTRFEDQTIDLAQVLAEAR